jgi:hypothetical protein
LHLYVWTGSQLLWRSTRQPLTREDLDDNDVSALTAYEKLAVMFNDYANVRFQNNCARHVDGKPTAHPLEGMEQIFAKCSDLDPNRPTLGANGQPVVRDGAWLRTQFKQMRSKITMVKSLRKHANCVFCTDLRSCTACPALRRFASDSSNLASRTRRTFMTNGTNFQSTSPPMCSRTRSWSSPWRRWTSLGRHCPTQCSVIPVSADPESGNSGQASTSFVLPVLTTLNI